MDKFKLCSGSVYGNSCYDMIRNCTVYAVEIYNCEYGKFELLEAWQLTRAHGWTKRETKNVWDSLHDAIMLGCKNVVARVCNSTLDDMAWKGDYIMKFQSFVDDSCYPVLKVHDITRNIHYPVEHVNRRATRLWYLAR